MESKKVSAEEKEKLQEMLQGQKKRSYERMVQAGRSADEAHEGYILGGIFGRRGFAIILLLLGGMNIFFGVQGLIALNRLASSPFPTSNSFLTVIFGFTLGWGVVLLAIGILNLAIRHLKMRLVNGIFLIVSSLIYLLGGNLIGAVVQLAIGIYFIYRYSKTVKFIRSREVD